MISTLFVLIHDEARKIWCFRWLALFTALAIAVVGGVYVARLPNVDDAWGQVFVSKETPVAVATQGVSLAGDNGGTTYFVQKTLLNDKTLERVVRRLNPTMRNMSQPAVERAVATLRRRIVVAPDQGDGFFEFHYRDKDARRARDVVQLLLDDFLNRNLTRNEQQLRQAGKFLDDQVAAYETMLAQSQQKISAFHSRNPRFVMTSAAAGTGLLDLAPPPSAAAASPDLAAARAAYDTALAQSGGRPAAAPPSVAAARVAELEARLAALRIQYTEQHPDVVATKRQLADAIAERNAELSAAPAAAAGPVVNPALEIARRRLLAAQRSVTPHTLALPAAPPAVQSEWTELQRNDEVLRLNYQQLISRREAVRLSEAVYGAESGKYQITREPTVPTVPIGPKRALYLAIVAVAAIGGGLATAYARAAVQGIFVSPRELEQTFQLPVVGTVAWEPAWSTRRSLRAGDPLGAIGAALGRAVAALTFRSLRKNVRGVS